MKRTRERSAAVRSGLEHVSGEIVIIQDADLEYDPKEYPKLVGPILEGKADVDFGSRFVGKAPIESTSSGIRSATEY